MPNTRPTYSAGSGYVDADAMLGLRNVTVGTANVSLGESESFGIYVANKSSSTQTYTLAKASTVPGAIYTVICGNAGGEINFAVDAADSIVGQTFATIAGTDPDTAQLSTTAGVGIKNTAATNVVGDQVTLISDGVATWYIQGIATGVWAVVS